MKVSTTGALTALLGMLAIVVHAVLVVMTTLGAGLGSTPDDPVPEISNILWAIALAGTLVVAGALLMVLSRWTKLLAIVYAVTWIILIGCYQAGWFLNAGDRWTDPLPFLLLEALLPLASSAFAIYGVWTYRSGSGAPHGTVSDRS